MDGLRVVVIGGGIAGLSAAYYAQKQGLEEGRPVQVTVVERSGRWGGKIDTALRGGFVIERGPDSFLARKTAMLDLARELGMDSELVPMNPQAQKSAIVHHGRLLPMPPGLMLGIPTAVLPFVATPLLSLRGKLRAGLDLVLPRRAPGEDESLGAFIERRLGREVLETITEPLLAGIYAGDTHSLSLRATFPQFAEMERRHRSVILGMIAGKRTNRVRAGASRNEPPAPGRAQAGDGAAGSAASRREAPAGALPEIARGSMFLTFRRGLSSLVERLTERLAEAGAVLAAGEAATAIEPAPDGRGYIVRTDGGRAIRADGVVAAAPAFTAAEWTGDLPELRALCGIPYVSVANAALAYREEDVRRSVGRAWEGTGFLVPRREGRLITACTWTSVKWLHAAPAGKMLLRAYIGRQGMEAAVEWSDERLLQGIREDLRQIAGLDAEPLFAEVSRMRRSMPQYPPGHMERLAEARRALASQRPGLVLCGAGYDGVGVPDCVRQGREAAQVLGRLFASRVQKNSQNCHRL